MSSAHSTRQKSSGGSLSLSHMHSEGNASRPHFHALLLPLRDHVVVTRGGRAGSFHSGYSQTRLRITHLRSR